MTAKLLTQNLEVGLVTTNMGAMRRFYEEVIGLPYKEELSFPGGLMHRYSIGDNVLKLVSYDSPPAQPGIPGGGPAATGIRYLSLSVGNMPEVVAAARAAGGEVPVDVTPFGGGIGFAFVADPDGNWIEMFGPV